MANLVNFESSWKKAHERKGVKKARDQLLEKAKLEYLRTEKKELEAQLRGDDKWMLPSISGRIEKSDDENSKSQKKKKKNEKSKKKKKKHSKESNSDVEAENQWVEKSSQQIPVQTKVIGPIKGPMLQRDSWMMAPPDGGLLPVTSREELRAQAQKEADEKQQEKNLLDAPGQHSRELNPYWKDGGAGIPEEVKEQNPAATTSHMAGDGGVLWLRKAITRCEEQAAERGVTVEEVASERYKSFEDLQNRLREAEENAMMAVRNRHRSKSRDNSNSRPSRYYNNTSRREQERTRYESKRDTRRDYSSDSSSDSDDSCDKQKSKCDDKKRVDHENSRRNINRSDYDSRSRRRRDKDQSRDRNRNRDQSRDRDRSRDRNRDRDQSRDRDRSRDRNRNRDQSRDRDRSRDRKRDKGRYSQDRDRDNHRRDRNPDDSYKKVNRTEQPRGNGLKSLRGKFKRPDQNSDSDTEIKQSYTRPNKDTNRESSSSGWRKKTFRKPDNDTPSKEYTEKIQLPAKQEVKLDKNATAESVSKPRDAVTLKRKPSSNSGSSSGSASSASESDSSRKQTTVQELKDEETVVILSEQEMNKLGAKIVRAEIMGDQVLADKLKSQLEAARQAKADAPQIVKQNEKKHTKTTQQDEDKEVVLTRTDRRGMVRPVIESGDAVTMSSSKRRHKTNKAKTHAGSKGERERYFADDDRFDLKTLVQQEKLGTAETHDEMFMRLAGKQADKATDDWNVDDMFVERAAKETSDSMKEKRDKVQAIMEHKKVSAAMDKCSWCFEKVPKHLIIAIGIKVYLCLPEHRSLTEGHCMIVPMQHVAQATSVDEDVWDEIQVFRKGLTKMFEVQGEDCVFMEMSKNLKHHPHMFLDCVPIPKETGDMAPLYFKKAILDSDAEWTQNKKLVDLSQKGIRNSIPKGFPYFSVDFGLQGGFAHVIEDEAVFPNYFGREIVGGMIDAGPELWRKPHKENFEQQRQKVLAFAELWRPYDWTQRLKSKQSSESESD